MRLLQRLARKENIFARIICLLIACAMWVYVMTDQNPIVERSVEVHLQQNNLPNNMMVFNAPEKILVRVRGSRTQVMADNLDKQISASINLKNITEGQQSLPITVTYAGGEVVTVTPKEVSIYVDTVSEKKVPVTTRIVGAVSSDMTIGTSVITPPEVTLRGATHRIDKVNKVVAPIDVTDHTGSFEADVVIEERANALASETFNVANTEYIIDEITDKTIDFSVHSRYYNYNGLQLNSVATYQVDNAITAITAMHVLLGTEITQEKIQLGLDDFVWPGRMEILEDNLVIDGAHNESAIERFTESVNRNYPTQKKKLLFAVAGDKDYEPMITYLISNLDITEVYVTSLDSARAISAEYIAALFREAAKKQGKTTIRVSAENDIKTCLKQAYQSLETPGETLFCVGSLYLIGKIKDIWRRSV